MTTTFEHKFAGARKIQMLAHSGGTSYKHLQCALAWKGIGIEGLPTFEAFILVKGDPKDKLGKVPWSATAECTLEGLAPDGTVVLSRVPELPKVTCRKKFGTNTRALGFQRDFQEEHVSKMEDGEGAITLRATVVWKELELDGQAVSID